MTTTEAALRDLVDWAHQLMPRTYVKWHHAAREALSQPSPASSTAGEGARANMRCILGIAKSTVRSREDMRTALSMIASIAEKDLRFSPSSGEPVKRIEDGHADTEGEAAEAWAHLNCPACGGSGHIEDVHGKVSGEPASVAVEAETLIAAGFDDYAAHCALKTESDGGFCHAYFYSDGQWRFQTGGHDLTIGKDTVRCVLTKRLYAHPPLSKPTPVEAGALDWLRVAKLAGEFGVRYRTNTALEQFLAALSETLPEESVAFLATTEAMDDVKSHRSAWRSAIGGMIKLAEQQNPHKPDDDADLSYWQHELRAFDRTFDALTESPDEAALPVSADAAESEVECTFVECPPGLFRWGGLLCFKSEYSTKPGQPDAYCCDSGEYFWGGTKGDLAARRALMVTPVSGVL